MATCPRCLGPLTENHHCPHRLLRRVTNALWIVGAGAIGGLMTWVIWERPAPALVLAAAALGAVLASALREAVGRKS
jgi:hypothetical protein